MTRASKAMWTVLLACLSAVFVTTSHAQDAVGVEKLTGTLAKIRSTGSVTIGYRDASIPFSYLGPGRRPIGYSIDLCLAIVDEIKAELGTDTIQVKYFPVNSQTRIPLVVDGTVDLECGSTTNNLERQKQVAFSPIFFVSGTKLMIKRGAKFRSYRDLKEHTVAVTEGTTNEAAIKAVNAREGLGIKVVEFRDHDQSFAALASGKVDAWAGDDALLYAQAAESKNPGDFVVLGDYLSYDPYGIMFRKNDSQLAAVVTATLHSLAASRELEQTYDKWFLRQLPTGQRLNLPMSAQLAEVIRIMGDDSGTQ